VCSRSFPFNLVFARVCITAQVDRPNRGMDDEVGTGITMHEGADQVVAVRFTSNRVLGRWHLEIGSGWAAAFAPHFNHILVIGQENEMSV
jgi:hypothetical protein